jgi:hypothetical protein
MRGENQEIVGKVVGAMEGVKVVAEEGTVPSLDVGEVGMFDGGYFAVMRV